MVFDMKKRLAAAIAAMFLALGLLSGCGGSVMPSGTAASVPAASEPAPVVSEDAAPQPVYWNGAELPAWNGENPWTELNGNMPSFTDADKARTDAFESYSELDSLGRCGVAYANICRELMPTEDRGEIGSIRPSGWHTVRYNDLVSGNYLYNRCHLIGFQLAGENANEKNLITGTRYLNIEGMLDFENMVDDYVDDTGNHVLYRVTPVFAGDELVPRGVVMEGWSVEDEGDGICFCLFAHNVQPGIGIDYATGDSWRLDGRDQNEVEEAAADGEKRDFVVNVSSGKFHLPDCRYADSILVENRLDVHDTLAAMERAGYAPCGACHPDK